jgi:hypothetical protein
MALLTTQEIGYAGALPTLSAANASDTFVPDDRTFLWVKNTNASTRDITITTPKTGVGGLAIADVTVTIGATTGEEMIGPFPAQHFADASTGLATVTPTATAGVTLAVVKVPVPAGA